MATTKKKAIQRNDIISAYMEYVLEHEEFPKSVYAFCKAIKISEEQFYHFFGSIKSLDKAIWNAFYMNTIRVAEKNPDYQGFSNREKVLTFFFTFFELLTLNRSYVLYTLQYHEQPLKNMTQLKGLRQDIKDFMAELISEDQDKKSLKVTKVPKALFSEGAWVQFLFLLKFWIDDESEGFEKTDMAIEKSVNTIFDVVDHTPIDTILDFGKFLWKEKVV